MPGDEAAGTLDLPLITEATNEFYRQVYGDPVLYPIFRGHDMVVLRRHVSYFIFQLSLFQEPMTERQIEYLRKAHAEVIEQRGITQRHFDMIASMLVSSLRACGAEGQQLLQLASKLRPVRDIFPPHKATIAGIEDVQGQKPKKQPSSDSACNEEVQQQQQQNNKQTVAQQDQQQPTQILTSFQQGRCCCGNHAAAQPPVGMKQRQGLQQDDIQEAAATAICKDTRQAKDRQRQPAREQEQEQQAQRAGGPHGIEKTKRWWKRLMTTIRSQ